jgi:hypothetical protein
MMRFAVQALGARLASFIRGMDIAGANVRAGWLGGPLLVVGVWASLIATLSPAITQLHHATVLFRPEPLEWALLLAGVATLTRSVRMRLVALPAAVWGVCVYAAYTAFADGGLIWTSVGATILAGVFSCALAPVVVTSLRARASRPGSIVHASQLRSPWCAAFAVAGPIGDWVASLWFPSSGLWGIPAKPSPLRTEIAFPCWVSFAVTVAVVFVVVDVAALRLVNSLAARMEGRDGAFPNTRTNRIDLGVGADQHVVPGPAEAPQNRSSGYREATGVTVLGSIAQAKAELCLSIWIDLGAVLVVVGYLLLAFGVISDILEALRNAIW